MSLDVLIRALDAAQRLGNEVVSLPVDETDYLNGGQRRGVVTVSKLEERIMLAVREAQERFRGVHLTVTNSAGLFAVGLVAALRVLSDVMKEEEAAAAREAALRLDPPTEAEITSHVAMRVGDAMKKALDEGRLLSHREIIDLNNAAMKEIVPDFEPPEVEIHQEEGRITFTAKPRTP